MNKLSADVKFRMYQVYIAIYNLPFASFDLQRKTTMLTALMGGAEWSWRVVGITPQALELLAENNYKYVLGKIRRAHLVDRFATARAVFEQPKPLSENEFFKLFWENDETVIALKEENKKGGLPRQILPIDFNLGLFQSNPLVGHKHGKKEADFLRKLHEDYKASIVATVPLRPIIKADIFQQINDAENRVSI